MIRRLTQASVLLLFTIGAIAVQAQEETDPDRRQGRVLTDEGIEQRKIGNNEAALTRFQEADKLLKTSRSALRVAATLEALGRFKEAVQWAEKVKPRATPTNDPDGAAQREAQELIARASQTQARVTILLPAGSGGELRLDGDIVAVANGRAEVQVDPGNHEVVLSGSDGQTRQSFLAVRGKPIEVRLDGRTVGAPSAVAKSEAGGGLPVWPFIVGAGGLVLGGVAGGLAGSAANSTSEFYDLCPDNNGVPQCATQADVDDAADLRDGIFVRNGVAIGLGVAGGALLGVGIIGLATASGSSSEVSLVPWIGPEIGGLSVGGRF